MATAVVDAVDVAVDLLGLDVVSSHVEEEEGPAVQHEEQGRGR